MVVKNFNSTLTTVVSKQSSTSMPVEEDINTDPCAVTQLEYINASNATISLQSSSNSSNELQNAFEFGNSQTFLMHI